MCTNPRRITNPTRFYYKDATKRQIIVPCGKCLECRAQKSNDWHLRIWSEVKRYNDIGGKVVFVTLSYKDSCLPFFEFEDKNGIYHKIPCFNKRDKNRFFNSMRKHQERLGFTGKDELPMRYICACEYGKDRVYKDSHGNIRRSTIRPHYHLLLFFPPRLIDLLNFKSQNDWKKYIQSFWTLGWCRWSKPESKGGKGIFVVDEFAGEYVSKYMLKDLDFYGHPELVNFLYDNDGKIIKDNLDKMKGRIPQHWQSLQFGSGLCDIYNNEDALLNGVDFHLTGDIQRGKSTKNKAPKYVRRKLLYTKDYENQRYVLTPFGVQIVVKEFEISLPDRVEKYCKLTKKEELSKVMSDEDITELFHDNSVTFNSVNSLCEHINEKLNGRSFVELYLYDSVWAGLFSEKSSYIDLDNLDFFDFYTVSLEQYLINNNKHFSEITGFNSEGIFKNKFEDFLKSYDITYYGSCSRFNGFEEILRYIHMCDGFIKARTHRQYQKEREQKLLMNHELLDFERRCLGSGFRSPRFNEPLTGEWIERKNRLLKKLRINN